MSDPSDLHGVYPTALRWNATDGFLARWIFDEAAGERMAKPIELGSSQARFAMDFATRERGYGQVRTGSYIMHLTPAGSPPPLWPGDDTFKPSVGMWLWNTSFGEVRIETNASLFVGVINSLWDNCRTFTEAAKGLQPVIEFADRRERVVKTLGKVFWYPSLLLSTGSSVRKF
jgi:hypothetical protein